MLPQVNWALENDISVLVMNPNHPSGTMNYHATKVWKDYVLNSGFKQINVIVHSAGASGLAQIQTEFEDTFYKQIKRIAYTDTWVYPKDKLSEEQ